MALSNQIGDVVRSLEPEDWTILHSIERFLSSREVVPVKLVTHGANFPESEILFRLNRLNALGLVLHKGRGFSLVAKGLDVIALNALAKTDVVLEIGPQVGVGKEADVFRAKNPNGQVRALKFYRIGRTSFRSVARSRGYAEHPEGHRWLHLNVLAAQREFESLRELSEVAIGTPKPFARERHALVMEFIEGVLLSERPRMKSPKAELNSILSMLRLAYQRCGIVNGDLSEFNILYDGEKCWILDWPQSVRSNHPNAIQLLERDVRNIVRFFQRTYGVKADWQKNVERIRRKSPSRETEEKATARSSARFESL